MYSNGFNVYKNNSVNYASKEQLLLMLVDGAVKFSKQGREFMLEKDIKRSHECMIKTQDIFLELMATLDRQAGEWAEQIFQVYAFINTSLVSINMKKDTKELDKLIPLIESVRDLWYEVNEKVKQR